VQRFEPAVALYGGPNGLKSIRRLLADSPDLLRSGGLMLLEIGMGQREKIERMLCGSPFTEWEFQRDYGGIERVLRARRE
jgi:release factor glutamine methyltransferase